MVELLAGQLVAIGACDGVHIPRVHANVGPVPQGPHVGVCQGVGTLPSWRSQPGGRLLGEHAPTTADPP